MPISSVAMRFKRFRQRVVGINAPRVLVRTYVPWYWRALSVAVIVLVSLLAAFWLYGSMEHFPSADRDKAMREIASLQKNVTELTAELEKLRALSKTAEGSFQIERTLQQQLSTHIKQLETENAALRQDLVLFETLMPSSANANEGLKVDHLRVEPGDIAGEYRYRMLVVNTFGRQNKEMKGHLQLLVNVRRDDKDVMIAVPSESEPVPSNFRFEIKYFYRFEGVFSIPAGAQIKSVEARLMQDGVVRAKQSLSL